MDKRLVDLSLVPDFLLKAVGLRNALVLLAVQAHDEAIQCCHDGEYQQAVTLLEAERQWDKLREGLYA